jgi:hypothetical protein
MDRYEGKKNFLPITVFIPHTVPPAESARRIKEEVEICGWK